MSQDDALQALNKVMVHVQEKALLGDGGGGSAALHVNCVVDKCV